MGWDGAGEPASPPCRLPACLPAAHSPSCRGGGGGGGSISSLGGSADPQGSPGLPSSAGAGGRARREKFPQFRRRWRLRLLLERGQRGSIAWAGGRAGGSGSPAGGRAGGERWREGRSGEAAATRDRVLCCSSLAWRLEEDLLKIAVNRGGGGEAAGSGNTPRRRGGEKRSGGKRGAQEGRVDRCDGGGSPARPPASQGSGQGARARCVCGSRAPWQWGLAFGPLSQRGGHHFAPNLVCL